MVKQVDLNGYWLIEGNPVSKEGVFPYLGSQISSELEPDKIYMVYRPASELENEETVESFNAVPFIDEHEMIGEGFTKYDDRPAGGVLYNVRADNGILLGDFKIYSENLKDEIANGKKELSLGYLCDYELSRGVWNGQRYDAIQKNIRGNHVALVNKGRMGADVRVYDKAITMDSMPVEKGFKKAQDSAEQEKIAIVMKEFKEGKLKSSSGETVTDPEQAKAIAISEAKKIADKSIPDGQDKPETAGEEKAGNEGKEKMADKKAMDADKREAIREVMAIANKPDTDFEGGEEEKIETIAKILEKSEYSKSEAGTANDEDPDAEKDKKGEDKCGKDEDDAEKKEEEKKASEDEGESESEKKSEDEDDDEEEKKKEEEKKASEDSMPRQILKMIAKRDALVKQVEPLIGSFACDEMTEVDAAVYACQKLGLQVSQDEALPCLRGYLAAHKSNKMNNKVYGLDSAVSAENGVDKATQKYLKGE